MVIDNLSFCCANDFNNRLTVNFFDAFHTLELF